ncbi:MAG: LamG-like jellyroll fold domain-containing protein, partial [Saprospiraceae bacterium]
MSNKRTSKFGRKSVICAFILLLGLLVSQQWWGAIALATGAGRPLQAAAQVAQVWEKVRNSQQYDFSADVTVKTIPLATASNIGRFSKTDSLYLEGTNNLRKQNLQMALWGGGVSVADRANAYQVRVQDGNYQTRVGDGEWQASRENAVAFAPEGNFLAFLDMAKNVKLTSQPAPTSTEGKTGSLNDNLTAYAFDLDSQAYAQKLTSITQQQLVRSGELPIGAAIQVPDHLAKMSGTGELWVDERGLPVRQKIFLSMPPAPGSDNRSETEMDIYFSNYQLAPPLLASAPWLQPLLKPIAEIRPSEASTMAINFSLIALAFLALAALIRPNRTVQTVVTLVVVFCIVITPTLQAQASSIAIDRFTAQQDDQAATERQGAAEQKISESQRVAVAAAPYAPPEAALNLMAEAPALQSTTLDSDGDGLTDAQENLLGTNPHASDTDLDTIPDNVEVTGFNYAGKQWYGNPLLPDSNQDGAIDTQEWNPSAPDSDGDGSPDLYDFDDDGDGVPDALDISRLVGSKANDNSAITFTKDLPMQLNIGGLQANSYAFVDLQLRPTDANHLWYAFNVLNWPKDQKGNMQDWDGKTFFDVCKSAGGSNCNMSPDANGDIKVVPMLEVTIPDLSSLPRNPNGSLNSQLLEKYNISVQPAGNGSYYLYVPLNLVEDNLTGQKVAFQAQIVLQPGATVPTLPTRLVWSIHVLQEEFANEKDFQNAAPASLNRSTILHAYYDDFQLTGLNVREDHGVEMAIIYEDPASDPDVTEDDVLLQMMNGLDNSYMINRDCDLSDNAGNCVGNGQRDITIATLKQRWDRDSNSGITDSQRWGIPANRLRVETYSFAHADEATIMAGSQYAPAILNSRFSNTAATKPSLLFVRESRFRASNIDVRAGGSDSVNWVGRNVQLNLSAVPEMITGNYTLAPYRYDSGSNSWTRQTSQEVVKEIERRYPIDDSNTPAPSTVTSGEQMALIMVKVTGNNGTEAVLSQNGPSGLGSALTANGTIRLQAADIGDAGLQHIYQDALTAIGKMAPYLAKGTMLRSTGLSDAMWKKVTGNILFGIQMQTRGLSIKEWSKLNGNLQRLRAINTTEIATIARYRQVAVAPALVFFALGFFLTNVKGGQTAGEIMLSALTSVHDTVEAIANYRVVELTFKSLPYAQQLGGIQSAVLSFGHSLSSDVAKAGAVGAAIGIVVTWAFFFAAWGKGGISTDSVAFNTLLAGAIASTLVIVLTFFISLTVVGAIVLAIFGIFDLFALIACKAGAKKACDIGITAAITKVLTDWIYTGGMMIDTSGKPPIATVTDLNPRLTDPTRGLVAGNGVRFEVNIQTLVRHAAPEPGPVYHWDNFFTAEDIRSTSVQYALGPQQQKLKTALNQTYWNGWDVYSYNETEVPSPIVGWLVPIVKRIDLWRAIREDTLQSPVYPFAQPKINQNFPVTLSIGMALPTYNCWFGFCEHKVAQSSTAQNLSDAIVLDILPATLDGFVNWSELGAQIDQDGDGLTSLVDPNPLKWDSDSDGLPDGIERKYGYNPSQADVDNDGLLDPIELRFATNPRSADTDGDGISDKDEIEGYNMTFDGVTIRVTSNPTQRDSDTDGISDGAERRLNSINPARYPFNPNVFNESPARLYTTLSDEDRVLAVGASTTATTTVLNGTAVENSLVAAGVFTSSLPAQLGGASQTSNFTLLPSTSKDIVLNGTAGAANGTFNINTSVAADLVPVGSTQSGPIDDIILDNPVPFTIDSDPPSVPALTQGTFVQPGNTVIIGGTASDPTSYIAEVDVSVNGGAFSPATGTGVWAFPVDIPNQPSGIVPINVRAADAVNNTNSASYDLRIDGVAPTLSVVLTPGDVRQVRRNARGEWSLLLNGTVSDNLAGIESLTVQIGDSSNAIITATAINLGGAWSLDYPFDEPAFNAEAHPTGNYTLTVTARDNALPDGNPATQVIPFVIDMTPPTVTLLSHKDEMQLTDGAVLTGTVQDANSAVKSVDVAFVSANTVFSTGTTLLRLPLNDLPQSVVFENTASAQTRIYCLDDCPTSGIDGADGLAASFANNQLLRSFDPIDLPESGLTTALWFKTTCANCGLFSTVQGVYPAITEHDRELFLDTGKVCSSILVNATRETRCTAANIYADGNWHQVVHTLGVNGNALYVDGKLAASSPTTASTFSAQDGVLIGYAPAATSKFLTGVLDDIVIYEGALEPESAVALYRQWQPVAFSGNQWSVTVPNGLEGTYQVDMRAADTVGNYGDNRSEWRQLRAAIDTKLPSFDLKVAYAGSGSSATTIYSATVRDDNLSADNYKFACPLTPDQLRYATDPALLRFAGSGAEDLAEIAAQCTRPGFQSSLVAANACDEFGHCAAAIPPQSVAYIGTYQNTLSPFGSLPNAIERVNLSDPKNRVRLIERPGQLILDIAVDEAHGKLYWAEMVEGQYNQSAAIWRANLDGSSPEQLVNGLNAYAAEALQIAVDSAGNKLYWTQGYQLWWANLDGTFKQVVYSIPADPRYVGGALEIMQIGDVVVDNSNGHLYLSERRQRGDLAGYNSGIRDFGRIFRHTLIVAADLNGNNPAFVAGVGDGCTYANFYNNLGSGVGAGQQPTLCLTSGSDGFDVESLAVRNGTLYWSAIDADGVNAGVYGRAPISSTFKVAALGLSGNSHGLRTAPLPQMYIDGAAVGVFVGLDTQIVRGERDGSFTQFTTFVDNTPAAAGSSRRNSSTLSAFTVIETAQVVQQDADLAVGITAPSTVVVNGGSVRYDMTVRNDAALPALSTTLTMTLPQGASFASASRSCVDGGATVRCDFGSFDGLTQQSLSISLTIVTSSVHPLTTTVSVASSTLERNPANNSAVHSNITAAPNLSAFSGLPYIYYGNVTELTRVPLFGDYTSEPLFLSPSLAGSVLAADHVRNKLFLIDPLDKLVMMNPDGSGRVELANANPSGLSSSGRLHIAVDESTGRVYWSEIATFYLTTIKSAKPDGSDVQTVVSNVMDQRGLVVDPIRGKLFWVAGDTWQRQEFIYRSNLDGSNREIIYAASAGSQIRYLALDAYNQKLYWLDPATESGSLFWADADGGRVIALSGNLGSDARGLIVQPAENAIYYVSYTDLLRANLDGSNETTVANLSNRTYDGLRLPVDSNAFSPVLLTRPSGNLVLLSGTPFASPPCAVNDTHEPNNSAATATAIGVGNTTGALCKLRVSQPADIDFYTVTVPSGKQLNLTLSNLPADYNLYVQRAGVTVATSQNSGLTNETIAQPNYDSDGTYVVAVYSNLLGNNVNPYTLNVSLSEAPARTVFTNAECLAVDPNDAAGGAGNYQQSQATPLSVGTPITGALCYENDVDFFSFNAVAGQTFSFDLPMRPAAYELHLYRPNGSFFNAWNPSGFNQSVILDASGQWAVAVRMPNLTPTLATYQLLVKDDTCSLNDAWEPNNTAVQAASLSSNRVSATLCNANDADFYYFSATAGQRLTLNYPVNNAGGALRLLDANGVEQGRVLPGNQGNFVLGTGNYTLATNNGALATNDAAYNFQWLINAPQPATGTDYIYLGNLPHLLRVALSGDHAIEALSIAGAGPNQVRGAGYPMVTNATRDQLYLVDSTETALISTTTSGITSTVLIANANPDGVGAINNGIALDEMTGQIFWTQPVGAVASTASQILRGNLDGSGSPVQIKQILNQNGLLIDPVQGDLYWVANNAILRSKQDGSAEVTVRAAISGQQIANLTLDPLARQLYWIDTQQNQLVRRFLLDGSETTLVSGLSSPHGVVLRSERNELYYTSGDALLRANLDGSNPVQIATLSGQYNGPWNLNPNSNFPAPIGPPLSNMVLATGAPLLNPCTLADGNEPNNDAGTATALSVVTQTVAYGAICGNYGDVDYYKVSVADRKTLSVTLSELPANYRVIVQSPLGVNQAFSDNDGLADEVVAVSNSSGATLDYTVIVMGYGPVNNNRYKLTLELGDVPPPPNPDDLQCGAVDNYDAPGVGNGTLATATSLSFGTSYAAALCYSNDVDMYAFDGLAGQSIKIDLPVRPDNYDLTLYSPAGTQSAVISSTTSPAYADSIVLNASGRYTVAVSFPNLTPTTNQYQLLVTDENCVASDNNEPNNSQAFAKVLSNGSRVRATLCSASDVDLYQVSATTGQQLTVNYPANATGATLRVVPAAGGADLGVVTAGNQGIFTVPANGDYLLRVENNSLSGSALPYLFEVLLGSPTSPTSGSPYVYYSRVSDLIRTSLVTGTVEPILLPNTFTGGTVLAADSVRSKLYVLDYSERIVRANPDGTAAQVVVADTGPGVLRPTESLAVDERSGHIYWTQASFGVVSDIRSANADGSNVQTVITGVVDDHGLTIDPVAGRIYWAQTTLYNGAIVDHIRRSNLDGSNAQTIYAAPEGRQIRELTVDPFAQTLYWRDPTQNQLQQIPADGGDVTTIATVTGARGFVVRPLLNELYFVADSQLWRSDRNGNNPVSIARLDGDYSGVSNLDSNVFYPTVLTPPGSNLALANSVPFEQPCSAVDIYEPNDTMATAASITTGTLTAALCTASLTQNDLYDYYKLTVADGRQISVTLTNLPQDYSLVLIAGSVGVGWSYNSGTVDEFLTHINRSGSPVVYTILVSRGGANSSRLPYTLTVEEGAAPPPPPPPAPPADACAPYDVYDQPGYLGNQTRDAATLIGFNTPITAALCYSGDKDYYAFDGVVGQNVTIDLPVRPADYYVSIYDPNGNYVNGIFPGSWLNYGDKLTLNSAGRWTLVVWYPNLQPTTSQYQLLLSVNTACSGLDPYEPNNDEFAPHQILTRTVTLRTMLCETGDDDWYSFPMSVGDHIYITPRSLVPGMRIAIGFPSGGVGFIDGAYDYIATSAGDFRLGIYPPQNNTTENLPYEYNIEIVAPPAPTPLPNNWSCSVYPSSDIPKHIGDLMTLASTVSVPVSGTVTHIGLKDITFDHGGLWNLSFGLGAPDGTVKDLFAFDDYGFYTWCGGSNCKLSLDDAAQAGLHPPQFPNNGGTFRPSRSALAEFNGKASNGTWTFYVTDNFVADPNDTDAGDTTGDLFSWGLEVCVDNGNPPGPTATPVPTSTPEPQPTDGGPTGATAGETVVVTPTTEVCTLTADSFEDDDSALSAKAFDLAAGSSAGHNFDQVADADWQVITLTVGLQYTFTVNAVDSAQGASLSLYQADGTTLIRTAANQISYTPTSSGRYYLRITSDAGLGANLCRSDYSLVSESRNPNATPVPLPTGTPQPPNHVAPPISAAVLAPVSGSALTNTQPITVVVGLNT